MSRKSRAKVVLPLDEQPLMATITALRSVMIVEVMARVEELHKPLAKVDRSGTTRRTL